MKKFFPLAFVTVCVFGFFAGQIVLDLINTNASLSTKEKAKYEFISKSFNDLKLQGIEKQQIFKMNEVDQPIVVLNFWASWCTPCLKEFPSLHQLKQKLGSENIRVFAVNGDDKNLGKAVEDVQKKLKQKLNLDFVKDSSKLLEKYKINSLPTTLTFVNGKLIEFKIGLKDFTEEQYIKTLRSQIKSVKSKSTKSAPSKPLKANS